MERIFNRGICRFTVASILLAIVMLFHISSTMFYHVHEVDGVRVVHSHIYTHSQDDTADEGHSDDELKLIDYLNDITILTSERISIPEVEINSEYRRVSLSPLEPIRGSLFSRDSSRAPPAVVAA